jgi:hypothetical protein
MPEKTSGSSGSTVPNRRGVGVSRYGCGRVPSADHTIGMSVYISGQ